MNLSPPNGPVNLSPWDYDQGDDHVDISRATADAGPRPGSKPAPSVPGRLPCFWASRCARCAGSSPASAARGSKPRPMATGADHRHTVSLRRSALASSSWPEPAMPVDTLNGICCFKSLRTVANDSTVQLGERLFHILTRAPSPPLGWRDRQPHPDLVGGSPNVSRPPQPARDHPWRRYDAVARRKLRQAQRVTGLLAYDGRPVHSATVAGAAPASAVYRPANAASAR